MKTRPLDGSGPGETERRQYGPDSPEFDPDRTDIEQDDPSRTPAREDDDADEETPA